MKKRLVLVLGMLMVLVILVISVVTIINIKEQKVMKSCDLLVGVSIFHNEFKTEKILYGYKEGKLLKISNRFKTDESNFNYIIGTQDIAAYFDYDTYMDLYAAIGSGISSTEYRGMDIDTPISRADKEKFYTYYSNYSYNLEEKQVFDSMIDSLIKKHESDDRYYNVENFFVFDHEYYLYTYENGKTIMYKYENDALKKIFELTKGESLLYFKKNS